MYIKRIDIDNFKSFATKIEIPLLKGFTTISGPNGSGKSNIIDSVLFCLGLSKSRALRAERLADFVSTYTRKNEATVTVVFGEAKDNSEFSVTRRIKKTSQGFNSFYYLDDKQVTHEDILTKLEEYNVTPNSFNVMMQGDVVSIINCTDNQRRNIIDEIAGVADFNRRIDSAKEKLDVVDGRVKDTNIKLGEIETRLEQLKEEKEVAIKYKKLKDEKVELESQVNTVKFFDIKGKLEQAHTNILEFTKKQTQEKHNKKDLEERIKLIDEQYQEICEEVKEKGEARHLELQEKLQNCKGEIDRKQNAINFEDKQIQDNKVTIENMKNGIKNHDSKIEDDNEKIKAKNLDIKVIDEEIGKQRAERKRIVQDLSGLSNNYEQQINRREELRTQLDGLRDKENSLIQKKSPLEADLKTIKDKVDTAKESISNYDSLKETYEQKKESLDLQLEQLRQEQEDCKIAQRNVAYDLDKINNEINDLDVEYNNASRMFARIEAKRDVRAVSSGNRAIETVENAHLEGVHAPLYKLGTVDKEYSTALEVAIGGRMANIVVDDPDTAISVFEIVKSAGAGRVTCIPLNKIKEAPTSLNLPREQGIIDYAINLIDFDDEYLDAFYYAVGDTIVVENDYVAKKLIRKYRMVTLDGTLYEKTGAMTGGSRAVSGFKFSVNDDDELEKYKEKLREIKNKLDKAKKRKEELEDKRERTRMEFSKATSAFSQANNEFRNLEATFETSKTTYTQNQEFIKATEPEVERLNNELDKLEEQHIDIIDELAQVRAKIEEIDSLLADSDVNKLKELTEDIDNEIERLETNRRTYENEIQSLNLDITFHETGKQNNNDTIQNCLNKIKESENNKILFDDEIKILREQEQDLQEQVNEIKEKLGDLLKKRDEINQQLTDIKVKDEVKQKELDQIAEQIESFKARRREIEPELETARKELEDAGVEISKLQPVTITIDELNAKIQRLSKRMDDLGNVNMRAIEEFEAVSQREKELRDKVDTLTKERLEILNRMNGYEQLKKEAFMTTYNNINANFKEVYHQLSDGEGTLILQNEQNPFAGGLSIEAQPRDKDKQRLAGLSGGEKSLAALAFVFAIQKYLPAPFYALDEVDQSLDPINVEKLAAIVQAQAKDSQFIVVSHKKLMINAGERTIGVTQQEKGKSKVTGVTND